MRENRPDAIVQVQVSKSASLVIIVVLLAIVLFAGAVGIAYYQYKRYIKTCEEEARRQAQRRRVSERLEALEEQELIEGGAVVRVEVVKGKTGEVVVKADGREFGSILNELEQKQPDYRALHRYVAARVKHFEPSEKSPSLKVVIDASEEVDFKHVIHTLNECVRAGVVDISFAAPELTKQK